MFAAIESLVAPALRGLRASVDGTEELACLIADVRDRQEWGRQLTREISTDEFP
jgi:hypothetical protein